MNIKIKQITGNFLSRSVFKLKRSSNQIEEYQEENLKPLRDF